MKVRQDFVSNSSSSSYIVVCSAGKPADSIAYDIAEKALGDDSAETKNFFNGYTCLTTKDITFSYFSAKLDGMTDNHIVAGVCVPDEDLSKYFDENGEVRKDLVFENVVKDFTWYAEGGEDSWDENEEVVYNRRVMGKINDKTVKMMSWLAANAIEWFGNGKVFTNWFSDVLSPEDIDTKLELDKIQKYLDDGKQLFFTRYSYQGDAYVYGHIYVDDVHDWKRSIGQWLKEDVSEVEDAWYVEN